MQPLCLWQLSKQLICSNNTVCLCHTTTHEIGIMITLQPSVILHVYKASTAGVSQSIVFMHQCKWRVTMFSLLLATIELVQRLHILLPHYNSIFTCVYINMSMRVHECVHVCRMCSSIWFGASMVTCIYVHVHVCRLNS